MSYKTTTLATCLLLAVAPSAALAISVDSDLNDWIEQPTGEVSDWSDVLDPLIGYSFEDQTGDAGAYLDPGWGGQTYDAEAMYVRRTGSIIDIAVVTGRAPGASGWAAGDIALDFGNDGSFEYGVVTLRDGTGIQDDAGMVYRVDEWNYGLNHSAAGFDRYDHPTTIKEGDDVYQANLSYAAMTYDGKSGGTGPDQVQLGEYAADAEKHYVIETSIDLALIDPALSSEAFLVHWTMACANDIVQVAQAAVPPPPPNTAVPSPAPLALLLIGMTALFGRRLAKR
jgi:hypothetical protein